MAFTKAQKQSARNFYLESAAQGRNGDTMIAHVTPGEVVIPVEVAATQPGLINSVMRTVRSMGGDPSKLKVGQGSINPVTGMEEFATDAVVADAYGQAAAMYQAHLGRAGDQEGINYWANQIASGKNISNDFKAAIKSVHEDYAKTGSSPYAALLDQDINNESRSVASKENRDQAAAMYTTNLGRAGDQEGINYWANQIASGKNISNDFKVSAKSVYEDYAKTGSSPYANLLNQDFKASALGASPKDSLKSPISTYIYGAAPTAPIPTAPIPTAPIPTAPIPTAPIPPAPIPTAPIPPAPIPTAPIPPAPTAPIPAEPVAAQAEQERWQVAPRMTVQQQAADIINVDSPLMQQARSIAMQQMNARGLINSSMAITAGQQAVLNSAVDIGKQDANTYASAGQFNAGQSNDMSKFNTGQTNTWSTNALDRTQQTNERLGAQDYNSGERALDRTFSTSERLGTQGFNSGERALDRTFNSGENALDRGQTAAQNDANRTFTSGQSALDRNLTTTQSALNRTATSAENEANRAFTGGQNSLNRTSTQGDAAAGREFTSGQNALSRAADLEKYRLDATTRADLLRIGNAHDVQMQKDRVVASAYEQAVNRTAAIDADPNLDAPAKAVAKDRVTNQFTAYAKVRGLNLDLVFEPPVRAAPVASPNEAQGLVNTASGFNNSFGGSAGDNGA